MSVSSRLQSGGTFYDTKELNIHYQIKNLVSLFICFTAVLYVLIARHKTVINSVHTSILQLITECWDGVALNRPSFDHIKKTLHRINPHKMSPVDLMMNMVVFGSLKKSFLVYRH